VLTAARQYVEVKPVPFKRLLVIVLAVAGILLVPLIAMQFTREVQWTAVDFLVAAVLLLAAGLSFEFLSRRSTPRGLVFIGITVGVVLAVVWLELAVGIFGSPWAGS
jgi:Kef-type K+ transport system membrane component KefB